MTRSLSYLVSGSTSANFDFGQFDFGQFLDVEFWDDKVWGPGNEGWGPEGWSPEGWGAQRVEAPNLYVIVDARDESKRIIQKT